MEGAWLAPAFFISGDLLLFLSRSFPHRLKRQLFSSRANLFKVIDHAIDSFLVTNGIKSNPTLPRIGNIIGEIGNVGDAHEVLPRDGQLTPLCPSCGSRSTCSWLSSQQLIFFPLPATYWFDILLTISCSGPSARRRPPEFLNVFGQSRKAGPTTQGWPRRVRASPRAIPFPLSLDNLCLQSVKW